MTAGCDFDPKTGRLRLTPTAVEALAKLHSDLEPDADALEELRSGGVMIGDQVHPRLVPVSRCVAQPLAKVVADHLSPAQWHLAAWVDDEIAVLLRFSTHLRESSGDVVAVPRGMVPLTLARMIDLGPRPEVKVGDPVELDDGLLEALLGPGRGWSPDAIETMSSSQEPMLPEWLDVLTELSNRPIRRWRVGAWWNSAEESPAARLLEVVEGKVGSFLLTHHRSPGQRYRRARLHPLSATQLWRLLCGLGPPAEEVEGPLD